MNKNGFTFIELLAVIVLIALITVIAVPTIKLADKKIRTKNLNAKLDLIKIAAESYGDDNKDVLLYQTTTTYTDPSNNVKYPSITVTVRDLLNNGYLVKDKNGKGEDIINPVTKESLLNKTITIYYKNNRVKAKLNF